MAMMFDPISWTYERGTTRDKQASLGSDMRCNACCQPMGCFLGIAVSAAITGLIGLGLVWTCCASKNIVPRMVRR